MSKLTVDARGLSCPEPVLLTRRAIDSGAAEIEVSVSTTTARDNVARVAERYGYEVSAASSPEGGFLVILTKPESITK